MKVKRETLKQLRNQFHDAGMYTKMRDGRISVLWPKRLDDGFVEFQHDLVFPDPEIVSLFIENRILPEFKNANR